MGVAKLATPGGSPDIPADESDEFNESVSLNAAGLRSADRSTRSPDPIAAIVFMMEQKGLTRRDLEPAIGSRARVAEILNKRRALTLPMIRALSRLLDLPADVLVQGYEVRRVA